MNDVSRTPVCRWCGNPEYTHIGMCPRVKSVHTHADGTETVELAVLRTDDANVRDQLAIVADRLQRIELMLLNQLPGPANTA